jgi:Transcriptional regulatory protein, C terminal
VEGSERRSMRPSGETRRGFSELAGTLRIVVPDERSSRSITELDPVPADEAAQRTALVSTVLLVPKANAAFASPSRPWVAVFAPSLDAIRTWIGTQETLKVRLDDPSDDHVPDGPDLTIDTRTRIVRWGNDRVAVTHLEYRLLETLAADRGRAVSFWELRTSAWGEGPELKGDIFALRSAIQRLRRKLRQVGAPELLEAIRGFGFRLLHTADLGSR